MRLPINFLSAIFLSLAFIPIVFANPSHSWLVSQQIANGSYSNSDDIALTSQATSETITALLMDAAATSASLQPALGFLATTDASHTESLSRQIIAAIAIAGSADASLISQLGALQNADGGFGSYGGYESDAVATAWALRAYSAARLNNAVVSNAIGYLLLAPNADKGWHVDNSSSVAVTSEVLIALNGFKQYSGVAQASTYARSYLISQRQSGLWSEDFESALALSALSFGGVTVADLQASAQLLEARKNASNNWDNDVYTTALVLQALKRVNSLSNPTNGNGTLYGQVFLAGSSEPIANANVSVSGNAAIVKTDATGRFTITGVAEGLVTLSIQKPGFQSISKAAQVVASINTDVGAVYLSQGIAQSVLSGRVFDGNSSEAIGSANLSLTGASNLSLSTSNNGNFEATAIAPGSYSFTLSAQGYYPVSGSFVVVAGAHSVINQALVSTATPLVSDPISVSGVIVDGSNNTPIPFALVAVDDVPITADANGQFTTVKIARGNHKLTVSASGYVAAEYSFNLVAGASGNLGNLPIFSITSVNGTQELQILAKIVDGVSGSPVIGANVTVVSTAIAAISDAQGLVTLSHIRDLTFTVSITASGYQAQQYVMQASGFGSVGATFQLTPQTANNDVFTLSGIVRDSVTNMPLSGVELSISGLSNVVTAADGSYQFANMKNVPFTLRATKDGYKFYQKDISVSEPAGAYKFDVLMIADSSANAFRIDALDIAPSLEPDTTASISVSIKNLTGDLQSALVVGRVIDSSGAEVSLISPEISPHIDFAANQSVTLHMPWSVGQASAGDYIVEVTVVEPGTMTKDLPLGRVLVSKEANTSVVGVPKFGGAMDINPPLLQAGATTPITIKATLRNTGNQTLPAGDYELSIYGDDEAHPINIIQRSIANEVLQNGVFGFDFGQWNPPANVVGQLHTRLVRTDGIKGAVIGEIYIGDMAKAQLTIDKTVLPEGNSNIKGNLHITGVDTRTSTSVDPLFVLVKSSLEQGAAYTGPTSIQWTKEKQCVGCHLQTQTLVGLGASLDKANINRDDAKYLLNAITTAQQDGGRIENTSGESKSATLFASWALTQWPKQEQTYLTQVRAAQWLWSARSMDGNNIYWQRDRTVGWMGWTWSATALATTMASNLIETSAKLKEKPKSYYWGGWVPQASSLGGQDVLKSTAEGVYIAKSNGSLEFVGDDNSKRLLFSRLPGVSGRINGLEKDADGNFWMSTEQGTVVKTNATGAILGTYQVCSGRTGGLVLNGSGDFYVACHEEHLIKKLTNGGQITLMSNSNLLSKPYGLAMHPDGFLLIANYLGKNILKMDSNGSVSVFANGTWGYPVHLTVGNSGDTFVTTWRDSGTVNSINKISREGIAERALYDPREYLWSIINHKGRLIASNIVFQRLETIGEAPLDDRIAETYRAAMPQIAQYYLNNYPFDYFNNIDASNVLIGLSEARKHLPAGSQRDIVDSKIKYLDELLRSRQSVEGGWSWFGKADSTSNKQENGNPNAYKPDPLMTALVGIAMEHTSPSPQDPMIRNSITYLLNSQKANGTWDTKTRLFGNENTGGSIMGTSGLVMAYMPKALDRLGGLDVKIDLDVPSSVVLSNPSIPATITTPGIDGATHYLWDIKGVTGAGRDIAFDLGINNLALNETRRIATLATLSFGNSFTNETIVAPIDIPSVNALSKVALGVATDKTSYAANEVVQLTSSITNNGPAFAGGDVKLGIRAAGYVGLLDNLSSSHVNALAQQQGVNLPNSWNTGSTFAGNYEVFAQLIDTQGRVVAEATAPFTIRSTGNNNQLLGSQVFTDKARYFNTDSIHIDARVLNTSLNLVHDPVLGRLIVKRVGDSTPVFTHSYAIPQLVIGGNTANQDTLAKLPVGQYSVQWQVYDAPGVNLIAQSAAQFEVVQDIRASIGGSVLVANSTVDAGGAQSCTFTVKNNLATSVSGLAVTETVINLDAQNVEASFNVPTTLAGNAGQEDVRKLTTVGYEQGQYACVLQAVLDGQTLNLGQALFTVTKPSIRLEGDISITGRGRLLVLIDDAKTLDQENYLKGLLTNAGWYYTIVKNPKDFDREMSEGGYSVYALLSQQTTLTPQTRDALKAKVANGDGLLVSDGHDRRHQSLEEALGVRVHSKKTHITGLQVQQSPISAGWFYTFKDQLNSLTFDKTNGTVFGEYLLASNKDKSPKEVLGAASDFNVFVLENHTSLSSMIEGRLAVGGNLNINNFSVGEKLSPSFKGDVVVVGGEAIFPSGRISYGNLTAAGSVAGVGTAVRNGMAKDATVAGGSTLDIDFAAEGDMLRELSTNLGALTANGTYTFQYGIYNLKGDCKSSLQVFSLKAAELATANTIKNSCIPKDATVLFNIVGESVAIQNIGMQSLTSIRDKVMFNFPQAKTVKLTSVAIEGSILAPLAQFDQPAGRVEGQVIARVWNSTNNGYMSVHNYPFAGDLSAGVDYTTKNAIAYYQYQQGKTVFAGLDMLTQAQQLQPILKAAETNNFAQWILSSLSYVSPEVALGRAGKVVPILVTYKNAGAQLTNGQAKLVIPVQLKVLNKGAFNAVANSPTDWVSGFSLAPAAQVTDTLYVQLPATSTTNTIQLLLQTFSGENATTRFTKTLPVSAQ